MWIKTVEEKFTQRPANDNFYPICMSEVLLELLDISTPDNITHKY